MGRIQCEVFCRGRGGCHLIVVSEGCVQWAKENSQFFAPVCSEKRFGVSPAIGSASMKFFSNAVLTFVSSSAFDQGAEPFGGGGCK